MAPPAKLALSIRIGRDGQTLIGPGRADLLMHIEQQGSIAAAGRQMSMSYKRAWALVEAMNGSFPRPLVTAAKGGAGGGGARLTAEGKSVLAAYRTVQQLAAEAGAGPLGEIGKALAVPPRLKTG